MYQAYQATRAEPVRPQPSQVQLGQDSKFEGTSTSRQGALSRSGRCLTSSDYPKHDIIHAAAVAVQETPAAPAAKKPMDFATSAVRLGARTLADTHRGLRTRHTRPRGLSLSGRSHPRSSWAMITNLWAHPRRAKVPLLLVTIPFTLISQTTRSTISH